MLKLIIVVLSLGNVLFPDDLNIHGGGCCSYSILTTLFVSLSWQTQIAYIIFAYLFKSASFK